MAHCLPPNFFQPHRALNPSLPTDSGSVRNGPPMAAPDLPVTTDWRIRQVIAILTTDLSHAHTSEELAARVGLSASRLAHLFKAETGLSPRQYLVHLRLHAALALLATTSLSVKEVMHRVGVCDRSYFNRLIRKHSRHAPGEYRKLARAEPRQPDSRIVQKTAELSNLPGAEIERSFGA